MGTNNFQETFPTRKTFSYQIPKGTARIWEVLEIPSVLNKPKIMIAIARILITQTGIEKFVNPNNPGLNNNRLSEYGCVEFSHFE